MDFSAPNIKNQTITINGKIYSGDDILAMEHAPFSDDLLLFLKEWFDDSPLLTVHTSGSTGIPKVMKVEKSKMLQSARLTCNFLKLKKGDTALLCMNLKYIGAKMMVVRSLLAGLNLIPVKVSGYPLADALATDFAAMTPMQVFNTLQDETQREKLKSIHHLIIGGGAVDPALAKELASFPHAVWSTYGMTETLSHIALRQINGRNASEWYTPFDCVSVSLSDTQTLMIAAPLITEEVLITNDIAEINQQGQFRISGRRDNVINSGSIKIQIEEIETLLKESIGTNFVITSAKDPKFGEVVILLTKEGQSDLKHLQNICTALLPQHWIPKRIFVVQDIPHTETNKPDRRQAKTIAERLYRSAK